MNTTRAGWRDRSLTDKRTRLLTIWMLHQCCDKIDWNLRERYWVSLALDMNIHSSERFKRRLEDGGWTHGMAVVRKLEAYIFVDE
jgi:hypothetical protein